MIFPNILSCISYLINTPAVSVNILQFSAATIDLFVLVACKITYVQQILHVV